MDSRTRFLSTLLYGQPDRVPYLDEGIRLEVLDEWHRQGMPRNVDLDEFFNYDHREEIDPDLDPRPYPRHWPRKQSDLSGFFKRLDPARRKRLPRDWKRK